MIDLRLWRAALLAAPVALVVAMFSLQEVPEPLRPALPPDAFDGAAAATLAAELAASQPDPRPGSEPDEALADLVQARFEAIPSAEISEQRFEASYEGEGVQLRNLIAVLPGQSERQVALIAHRDTDRGSGAAGSIAATAALLEIAAGFSGTTHEKTLVFVSTDGGSIGALGAKRFASDYTEADLLDAAVVLSQPASADPSPPLVVPFSTGTGSTAIKLARSANQTVSEQADQPAGDEGPLSELSRLAIPSALGEQGPLIEGGLDSIRISSAGELPLPPDRDQATDIDSESIDRFGRSALSLLLALDAAKDPLAHGPSTYIGLAGNLLPGWTLAMLALAMLFPPALVSAVAIARAARNPSQAAGALGWAALRAVPFLTGLALIFAFELAGLIPSPVFPFDPAQEGVGLAGALGVALAALAAGAVAFLLRPLLPPPPGLSACAGPAALLLAAAAAAVLWVLNPYLSLLVAIGLQFLVPAAAGAVPQPRRLAAAGLALAAVLPVAGAVADLARRFDAGFGVVWDLLLMLTGGQLGATQAALGCLLAGAAVAIIATNGKPPAPDVRQPGLRDLVERGRALERGKAKRREQAADRRRQRAERGADERRGAAGEELPARPEDEPPPPAQPPDDPRMWSKPPASTGSPRSSVISTPSPSTTRPILVKLVPVALTAAAAALRASGGSATSNS